MLTLKNLAINAVYYGLTVVVATVVLLAVERRLGLRGEPRLPLCVAALALELAGAALQIWCIVLFQRRGRGTPSPLIPTHSLVTQGPYGRVRNPMNLGEAIVLLGLAAWFASPLLVGYAVAAWLTFHAFIVLWEEPRLLLRHGDAYEQYRAAVPRWVPLTIASSPPRTPR